MPVIPTTWQVEIRRIEVLSQPRQKVIKTPHLNKLGYERGINRRIAVRS
jgi:hypothetical protein